MRIGPGCEISSVIDVVPELVEIGPETFFADGIYLGGPRVHRSTVTLAAVRCETNTFLGNHVVIPAGQRLPADILLGICTVSDDTQVRRGTSWFGHPPFELPRREVVECDRRFTHDPPLIRYVNRVLWEVVRFGLPITPLLVLLGWIKVLAWAEAALSWPLFLLAAIPGATLAAGAVLCLVVLAVKWALLGRVRPGQHPLWSCWCSRWDFLYVAWEIYARGALSSLEGTLLISWYLRAMGAKIGRRVVLGGGFAQVVDPDMLELEDEATVSAMFQAHTFEDRVLKIDRVKIRRRATVRSGVVLLYGADIGAGTHVAAHSVVMKQERLLPGRRYTGCPTRPEVS
jgi:non-ribosomal peptide synthetase-like protein